MRTGADFQSSYTDHLSRAQDPRMFSKHRSERKTIRQTHEKDKEGELPMCMTKDR